VPGTGPCPADIMIVGEAPGFNEDLQGKPFVGQAGKLLDTLLAGIDLRRGDVYITNVLKCRPPQNRDPMPNEVESCATYLTWQLKLVEPKVVIVLGRHALERLLPGHGPISRVHGQLVERGGINYVAVYHPAWSMTSRPTSSACAATWTRSSPHRLLPRRSPSRLPIPSS
jgi:uracil-DNA glycosylase